VQLGVTRAGVDGGSRPGTTTTDAERLREVEREVQELRRADAIRVELRPASRGSTTAQSLIVDDVDQHKQEFGGRPISQARKGADVQNCPQHRPRCQAAAAFG
jgi:hypothetical protein